MNFFHCSHSLFITKITKNFHSYLITKKKKKKNEQLIIWVSEPFDIPKSRGSSSVCSTVTTFPNR